MPQVTPDEARIELQRRAAAELQRRGVPVQPESTLSSMRFDATPAPAASTAVSPDIQKVGEPHYGILPRGTGERFERALPQLPITDDLSTGQQIGRTVGNLALGAAKFPVRMGTAVLEQPEQVPRGLAEFIPSLVNRLSTAAPGPGRRRFGPEFTGRESVRPTQEQVGQARRELMEEPFDVALLAAPFLKGAVGRGLKGLKPKAPPTSALAPPRPVVRGRIEAKPAAKPFHDFMAKETRKMLDEERGNSILDALDERGVTPEQVHKQFWADTYPKLSTESKAKFNSMIEQRYGAKPGKQKSASGEVFRDHKQIADEFSDFGDNFGNLEGGERGLIALEAYGNEMLVHRGLLPKPKPVEAPKPAAKPSRLLSEAELPENVRGNIRQHSLMRRTNEGGSVDAPDPYAKSSWQRETVGIDELRESGVQMPGAKFQPRGSRTKGPILVNRRGEIIDGNNRLYEAIQRGDKSIQVYREVAPPVPAPKAPRVRVPKPKPIAKVKPIVSELEQFQKSISAPQKLTTEQAQQQGIALRQTKGGRVVPSVRRSGVYVPEEFAQYKDFKDARAGFGGGTKDATRTIQEIDGALSVVKKVKTPGQAGPTERYVLWRTRDVSKMKMRWKGQQEQQLRSTFESISDKEAMVANRVLEKISQRGAYVAPEKLAASGSVSKITQDVKIIRFAQDARKYFDSLLDQQNRMRTIRNQPLIKRREYYTPYELQRQSLLAEAFGVRNSSVEIMQKPGLPDYIKPNKPFNPRELARQANLPEFTREMNLKRLMEHYTETAAKDMFNTSIIQNNKAFAQQLETMGKPNAARFIQDWTAEAYAGVKPGFDRVAFGQAGVVGRGLEKIARKYRQALVRGVFPLNIAWNLVVQPSSAVLTGTRYGLRSSARGFVDWFTNPKIRAEVANSYSFMVKSQRTGKITMQDVNQGLSRAVKIERGPLQTTADAFNFFTEQVERHLTGWSIATARRHGIRKGLKGKALQEYASDGGAKTQSMYNMEDLPGILRNESVKTAFPFQTFAFEVFNSMREFAGRTGTPPATQMVRIKWALRFLAGVTAANYAGNAAIGRKPWGASSLVPFYNVLDVIAKSLKGESVATATTRGLPSPIGTGTQFANGLRKGLKSGDWSKLRRASIRYLPGFVGIPAGTQASRVVDGIIAISDGGVKDASGKMLFPITDDKDKARALFSGPWSTSGGQEYWKKREKSWLDLLKKKEIEAPSGGGRRGGRSRGRTNGRR